MAATMRASMSLAVVGAAAATAGRPSVGVKINERHITPAREPKRVIIYPFNNPKKFTSIFSGQPSFEDPSFYEGTFVRVRLI
jgi:hypothetical protein